MDEIKQLLEDQARVFEDFKKKNDDRLAAIESKGYAPADLTETVNKLNAAMSDIGKQITAIEAKSNRPHLGDVKGLSAEQLEHKQALGKFMRDNDDAGLIAIHRKAMNSQSDPDGGYLVLPEIDREIDRVVPIISALGRLAKTVTIGSNKYEKRVKKTGMSMRRVADGAGSGETTEPTYANILIEAFTAEVEPWINNETLQDAFIDAEADLANEAAISFAEGAGSEFVAGNGVGKARGITAQTFVANASYAWGNVGYIASGASAAFAASNPSDNVVQLQHALKSQYRPGAAFIMADSTLGTLRQMKDASGNFYLWQPDPLGAFGGRILGSPVEVDDNMPVIAANSYSIAYGNWQRAYTVVNRVGTQLIRDNLTTKGVVKFNFRRRFGGNVHNFEAYKVMKFSTT